VNYWLSGEQVLGRGHTKKPATETKTQLHRNVTDFTQATDFQISRYTLRKLMSQQLPTSS
jgi:hypothetical protein